MTWKIDKKVAAYCRVSTDDQDNSLPNQIKYFTDYILNKKEENWELVDVYSDEAKSGTTTKNRYNFNRMIADAMAGKIDLILTKEVSRFARNTVDTLEYTRMLRKHGVNVLFTLDSIDTRDNDSELKLTIFASIAQEESRKTSERVKWGHRRRMEQGVVFGRNSMYGYKVVDGNMEIIPEEAKVVRRVFGLYAQGEGCQRISTILRNDEIKSKFKNDWSNTVILRMLRNEKYVGDLVQKKTITPDYLDHKKKYNKGEEEFVMIKNHHQGIVSREVWDVVQARLLENILPESAKRKHSNRYWCSGRIECSVCNNRFVSKTKKLMNGQNYRAWRCIKAARHGANEAKGGCDSESINEKVLLSSMQHVLGIIEINKDILKGELLDEIRALQSVRDVSSEMKQLEAKITRIEARLDKLVDMRLDGEITKEQHMKKKIDYQKEAECIKKQISDLINLDRMQRKQITETDKYIFEIDKILEFQNACENESVFSDILNRIVVHPNGILEIYMNAIPFGFRLHYKSSGRMDSYSVTFENVEMIDHIKKSAF